MQKGGGVRMLTHCRINWSMGGVDCGAGRKKGERVGVRQPTMGGSRWEWVQSRWSGAS